MNNKPVPGHEGFVRVIYENGFQVLRSDNQWLVPSSASHYTVASPEEFASRFAVRRVTGYRDVAPFLYPRQVFDPDGDRLSRPRYLAGYVEDSNRRVYKYMVEHQLFTALTHLAYLAEAYAGLAVLKNHTEWRISEDTVITSSHQLLNSALLHCESVFAALRSALDYTRYLVWRFRGDPPDTLSETIYEMENQDARLASILDPLDSSQLLWGPRTEGYRDCLAMYHAEESIEDRAGGELVVDDIWKIMIELPDDPLVSASQFTFANEIDALDTAWRGASDVTRAIEYSIPRVFRWAEEILATGRR